MRRAILVAPAVLALGVFGCAAPSPRGPVPESVRLDLPLYRGGGSRGAAAALAEVLTFWDRPTRPKDLAGPLLREPAPRAQARALPDALVLAAHERGMQARSFQATPGDVREELKLGHPLLAFMRPGPGPLARARFVVITGFDDGRGGFFLHSGGAAKFARYDTFMRRWERTGRWAILIVRSGL